MNEPLVSVVLATYRRKEELEKALESLANQTYSAFEVIVVDDNDDDKWNRVVKNIVSEFTERNGNISVSYIKNSSNLGSARTRNVGIEAGRGEYVCFLDDDDLYLADRIKNQVIAMEEAQADYSITDLALYSENDKLIEIRKRDYLVDYSIKSLLRCHLMYHITGTDVMMFRKDYLMKIGAFSSIDVGDEFYLMQKAIENGGKLLYIPICDVKAYVHTGEGGLSSGESKINGENQLFEYKKKYFDQLDNKDRRYIKMRHHAVLAFAYLRGRKYIEFIIHSMLSMLASPLACIRLLMRG